MAGFFAPLLLMAFALLPNPDQSSKKHFLSSPKAVDPNLYPLYLENTGIDSRFKRLIRLINHNNKKLVFQFFYQPNGYLTLGVYAGKKNHQGFDSLFDFKLSPDSVCKINTIDGLGVYLGDMEIRNQDSNLDSLDHIQANHNVKFVVFFPSIVMIPGTSKNTIIYEICTAANFDDICTKSLLANTGIITNPSPPHNGN